MGMIEECRVWFYSEITVDYSKTRNPMSFSSIHGLFPALLCLSHFPPLALLGIPVLIPVLPRWPVMEAYPRDL